MSTFLFNVIVEALVKIIRQKQATVTVTTKPGDIQIGKEEIKLCTDEMILIYIYLPKEHPKIC